MPDLEALKRRLRIRWTVTDARRAIEAIEALEAERDEALAWGDKLREALRLYERLGIGGVARAALGLPRPGAREEMTDRAAVVTAAERMERLDAERNKALAWGDKLRELILDARDELGVPTGDYPAPVANCHDKLTEALALPRPGGSPEG